MSQFFVCLYIVTDNYNSDQQHRTTLHAHEYRRTLCQVSCFRN